MELYGRLSSVEVLITTCSPYLHTYFSSSQSRPQGRALVIVTLNLVMKKVEHAQTTPDWRLDRSRPSNHLREPVTPQVMLHVCTLARSAFNMLLGCPLELQEDLRKSPIAIRVRSMCDDILRWVEPYVGPKQTISHLVLVLDGDYTKVTPLLAFLDNVHGLEGCGRRGCSKTIETSQLFQCSRCKTVLYCSKIHQKEDWFDSKRPHKAWCYRTPW
ncbi:hypothetical protein CALVIDRAFT_224199 [Calocera viscosa TUFC12733]|uniref:MYND-type domain-containing protein n=1 Tax=Calocera viscosa (strain TUFC12733) TaxID=1330018 RepID=A0A167K8N8_CALVF|nr:hypothetical protein CALVIDRAFT_224199 [Calocera viscosa TUFC12733]